MGFYGIIKQKEQPAQPIILGGLEVLQLGTFINAT